MTGVDLRGRLTLTIPEAGQLLGVGRDAAYAAAERGEIPTLSFGDRRKVVPTYAILNRLGWPDAQIAIAVGLTLEDTEAGSSPEPATATVHHLTALRSGEQHDDAPEPGPRPSDLTRS